MRHHKKAFTLIELLVVLSIISLLMGILLPVVHKVRAKGRSIACRANLHNLALAFRMYLDANNDIMPLAAQKPTKNTSFLPITHFLLPHVDKERKVFKCPADIGPESLFDTEGTSYEYFLLLGGKPVSKNFLTQRLGFKEGQVQVMYDFEPFHGKAGKLDAKNYLYADGHVGDIRGD